MQDNQDKETSMDNVHRKNKRLNKIPVEARFFTPLQSGPEAHPASYTTGNGSFPRVQRPERGVSLPLPSSAEVKEKVELYLNSPLCAFIAGYRLTFTFTKASHRRWYTPNSKPVDTGSSFPGKNRSMREADHSKSLCIRGTIRLPPHWFL